MAGLMADLVAALKACVMVEVSVAETAGLKDFQKE